MAVSHSSERCESLYVVCYRWSVLFKFIAPCRIQVDYRFFLSLSLVCMIHFYKYENNPHIESHAPVGKPSIFGRVNASQSRRINHFSFFLKVMQIRMRKKNEHKTQTTIDNAKGSTEIGSDNKIKSNNCDALLCSKWKSSAYKTPLFRSRLAFAALC